MPMTSTLKIPPTSIDCRPPDQYGSRAKYKNKGLTFLQGGGELCKVGEMLCNPVDQMGWHGKSVQREKEEIN